MKKVKVFCSWDLGVDMFHDKQVEVYVDSVPMNSIPVDTVRFVLLIEPPEILNLEARLLFGEENKTYNYVLTHDENILKRCKTAHLFEFGTTWLKEYDFPKKKFSVSALVGGKLITPGHTLRQKVWFKEERIESIPRNFYLSGNLGGISNINNNPVLGSTKHPLFNSQFHICIENTKRNNWFTEKLIDCLRTKTIPIYWGCPNIGNWFNTEGFFMVDTFQDIINVCNSLTENTYNEKLKFVEENFEKCQKFLTIADRLQDKINTLLAK